MWTARLPADLASGTHRVVVEAVTEYGDVVSGRIALEIA
jgi:methionine-rich copper-binding protein CopC